MGLSLPVPVVAIVTIGLLSPSNVFMAVAWDGHPGERPGRQHGVGFALICLGAWFIIHDWA